MATLQSMSRVLSFSDCIWVLEDVHFLEREGFIRIKSPRQDAGFRVNVVTFGGRELLDLIVV